MKEASIGFLTILAVAIVIALAFFATRALTDEKTIKIGFIGPLSGYAEKTGFEVKASIGSAVREINDRGGINGKKLELVAEDGKCSYSDAQEAARKLFANKISIIIGGVCETETRGAASVIGALNGARPEGKKVLLFAPCSSNSPDSTEKAVRLYQFDSQSYGAASADFAYNKLGAKTAAILRCENLWCSKLAVEFKKKFAELGGSVVSEYIDATAGKSDKEFALIIKAETAKIKDSDKADLAYFIGDVQHVFVGLAAMKKLNVSDNVEILATNSLTDPQVLQNDGSVRSLPDKMLTVVPATSKPDEEVCAPEARDVMMLLASSTGKTGIEDSNLMKNEFLEKASILRQDYILRTINNGGGPATLTT